MKRVVFLHLFALLLAPAFCQAQTTDSPESFYSTTEPVGRTAEGLATPNNQRITPAGSLVDLPGVRPNALALSPDGKLLVTSGLQHELLILDPAKGTVLQRVPFPAAAGDLGATAGSQTVLNANLKDKLSFTGIAFSPDGSRIYLSNVNGDIKVFAVGKDQKVSPLCSFPLSPVNLPDRKMDIPAGLAVSRDGKRLYVALNVSNQLRELDAATGKPLRQWNVGVAPFAVVLTRQRAYVSNWGGRRPDAASIIGPIGRNGTVRVDQHSVTSEGSVSVIDLAANCQLPAPGALAASAEILTGRQACALAVSPDEAFLACANAGEDTVSVIDTRSNQVVQTLNARHSPGDPFGAQPNALAFDKTGSRLFVCNGSQNAVAIFQFQPASRLLGLLPASHYHPGDAKLLGLVPVGWFPAGIAYDASRNQMDVANLIDIVPHREPATKNRGQGEGFNTRQFCGSLSLVPVPSAAALADDTRQALANLRYPLLEQAKLPPRSGRPPVPVPTRVGEPSVFQHVIYFVKENRTYDQVLGDIAEGNGNPDLCIYGEHVTPNLHKLVREFTLLDNTYCSGIISAEGHQWTDSGIATDYIQRSYSGWPRSYPGAGGEPHGYDALSYSPAGFLWDDALEHGKSVAVFGEFTTPHHVWKQSGRPVTSWTDMYHDFTSGSNAVAYWAEPGLHVFRSCMVSNYPGFDLQVPDAVRASVFIDHLKQFEATGSMPSLQVVWLPNDHTCGTRFGSPTPAAMVADNDLAFGKIIQALSHSRFWTNTCVFAIEDDPQDGWDHVSGYRTTAYVVSAYTRRHAVTHTQYNQTSLLRTMELILGIPPMNQMDATATPMLDCFTNTPDFTPFEAAPNQVALDTMNPRPKEIKNAQLRKDALLSARLPLEKEDQCPEDLFNRILWRATMGSERPYPQWAVTVRDDD